MANKSLFKSLIGQSRRSSGVHRRAAFGTVHIPQFFRNEFMGGELT
jgi:hypothetical protein